ncbi:MAG: cytochrome c oxidase assembly protein [Actinobacteria bacterium]|nr:cytochrome c oxidase assembly protein [Actinomycetota bacterium]
MPEPKSPDPKTIVLLFHWQAGWVGLLAVALSLASLAWYATAVRRLAFAREAGAATTRKWSPYTTASFVVGVLVLAYVFDGGINHYQRDNFTTHTVQLLLLVYVVPPLLAAGSPLRLVLLTSRGVAGRGLVRFLHSRSARLVLHPATGFVCTFATLYVYLLTPIYATSEHHPVLLAYAQLQLLVSSGFMWWAIVGRDALPRAIGFGWRFALVFASVPFIGFLGVDIAAASSPLYPGGNTLADTHQGANVLWALGVLFVVSALTYLFIEWAREEQRRADRADRQLDAALVAARSVSPPPGPSPGGV